MQEIEPLKIVDYLQQISSPVYVIPLADLMRRGEENICLIHDETLLNLWANGIVSIKLKNSEDLGHFREQMVKLNFFSTTFLVEAERKIIRVGQNLLNRLNNVQGNISQIWKEKLPSKAFFPLLELFFRKGELSVFEKKLSSLQALILQAYKIKIEEWRQKEVFDASRKKIDINIIKKYQDQYDAEIKITVKRLEDVLNFIISFYDRKWGLFLNFNEKKKS
ncbi:MAG: hypothetical protein V1872_10415 [bacterium]